MYVVIWPVVVAGGLWLVMWRCGVVLSYVVSRQVEASLLFIGFGAIVHFVGAVHFSIFPIKVGKSK